VNNMEDVTCIIKTFERENSCNRLIESIRKFYPNIKIHVADDSRKPLNIVGADKYIRLPFDTGLSYGRNVLVDSVETKYLVLLDDDLIFEGFTNLNLMKETLENTKFNLVAGLQGRQWWHGCFHKENNILYFSCLTWRDIIGGLKKYDFVGNFFMAKTDLVKAIKWRDEIKINAEHNLFFYDGLDKLNCTIVNSKVANNHNQDNEFYHIFRKGHYDSLACEKYYKVDNYKIVKKKGLYSEIYGSNKNEK
jgi:glycosyltransferase involved in cell wall biosynthesis